MSEADLLHMTSPLAKNPDPPTYHGTPFDETLLRTPQIDAYGAAKQHFDTDGSPAILALPVGCGKSGLAGLLSVGISRKRSLIVAPNVTIRDGLYDELNPDNPDSFWTKTGALGSTLPAPRVALINGPRTKKEDCLKADIVITNIQQLVGSSKLWLYQFEVDDFDLVIFDEGHHTAAASWQKVIAGYRDANFISLTATPFRTDGMSLHGEVIYRYPFARAMIHGYIARIESTSAQPSSLTFTVRGLAQRFSLDEILVMREEAWFRRGVALSDESNRHIASKSIEKLLAIRKESGFDHQIIASTMSINHAFAVRDIYRELGLHADLIHCYLSAEEKKAVLERLRDGDIDAIVQVSMLGEGFDHPLLSVAAIFRPYRSLSPYIQFIGRVMRTVDRENSYSPANRSCLVSHAGLNNEQRWDDFGLLDDEDQMVISALVHGDFGHMDAGIGGPPMGDGDPPVGPLVAVEEIDHYHSQDFLNPDNDQLVEELLDVKGPSGLSPRDMGVTLETLRDLLQKQRDRYEA